MNNEQRCAKRRRTDIDLRVNDEDDVVETHSGAPMLVKGTHIAKVESASRSSISPPPMRRAISAYRNESKDSPSQEVFQSKQSPSSSLSTSTIPQFVPTDTVPSPIQLSNVNGLPAASNVDTVGLKDILGDPLIKECWLFNYLYDVDFMLDVRGIVQIKVVHGSWKKEDLNRLYIEEAVKRYPNVKAITAYMPEMYGTHHSKMIILIRHDDTAQIVILTGNFIPHDWSMTQSVWRSPLLPLQDHHSHHTPDSQPSSIGSGPRFKRDILSYLHAYGSSKTGSLVAQLQAYDFTSIRAALVASVPGKQNLRNIDPDHETIFGWPALKHVLAHISPLPGEQKQPHIVMQVSSVASVGEKWLSTTFFPTLSVEKRMTAATKSPNISLIFPTADEIRESINGYGSGSSIHMRLQSAANQKQLRFLKPMLCHWGGSSPIPSHAGVSTATADNTSQLKTGRGDAMRSRAAPHIKSYIRFSSSAFNDEETAIDWAVMTSANLSKQAWGGPESASGEVKICSYEIGVVVWPGLWEEEEKKHQSGASNLEKKVSDEGRRASMYPVFGKDELDMRATREEVGEKDRKGVRVALRMPYSLPLTTYTADETPWCATEPYNERDCLGRTWNV
ncbi:MAG: hypothetical protein Q9214_002832 [Letrouitia sp. 1 TL-2023]